MDTYDRSSVTCIPFRTSAFLRHCLYLEAFFLFVLFFPLIISHKSLQYTKTTLQLLSNNAAALLPLPEQGNKIHHIFSRVSGNWQHLQQPGDACTTPSVATQSCFPSPPPAVRQSRASSKRVKLWGGYFPRLRCGATFPVIS